MPRVEAKVVALVAMLGSLLGGSALGAQEVAGPVEVRPNTYSRGSGGFREQFERLKANGYDKYVADLAASHPSERTLAATMLGVIGDRRAIPVLRSFLSKETHETTRHGAYVALILLGDRRYILELRKALKREIPEYADWIKKGIPDNRLASAARSFRVLAEHRVALPASVIEELFRRLDHVDSGVRIDAAVALENATGVSFGFRGDVSDAKASAPQAEAWRAWWRDNRGRFQAKENYVVNGLELVVAMEGDRFTATFHNRGPTSLRLPAPAPDLVTARREVACDPSGPTLRLMDTGGAVVQSLRSDSGPCSATFVPSDDVLHWESIELQPDAAYSFKLPRIDARGRVALAYVTAACGPGRWCGEVWSNVIGAGGSRGTP